MVLSDHNMPLNTFKKQNKKFSEISLYSFGGATKFK